MKQITTNYLKPFYILAALFVFSTMSSFVQAKEINASNPYLLINDVADELFADLAANKESYRADPERLKGLVKDKLLTYINYQYAAYKVLGQALKKTSKEDRLAFVDAFRVYLITSYASVMTLYDDQKVSIEKPKAVSQKTRRVSVQVKILQAGAEPINLNFKLLKNKKTQKWATYDLVAEGVSMITTKQNEWQSILRKKDGVKELTQKLNELASVKIEYKEK